MRYRRGSLQQVHVSVIGFEMPSPSIPAKYPRFSFPDVREAQVEHLARNLLSSIEPWKTAALKRKIEFYTSGVLPHAQDVLPALYHRLANPRTMSMRTPHPVQTPPKDGFDWQVLKSELTKSLSSGAFLNMELYAPASRLSGGQPQLRPLYFCSAVCGEYTTKILSCALFWLTIVLPQTKLLARCERDTLWI